MTEHKPNARPRERSQPPVSTGERIALVVGAIVVGGLWIVGGWFFAVILAHGSVCAPTVPIWAPSAQVHRNL